MYRLDSECSFEEIIKKSRFIAIAAPVESPEEAMAFFEKHHQPEATHNCWAFRIDPMLYRFNDDGEPGGTAGKPILQAIEGKELVKTAVLVIRYFGGTKLGTGGLIRAYGGAAAKCLQEAPRSEIIPTTLVDCDANYSDMEFIKSQLVTGDIAIRNESFNDVGVVWQLEIPDTALKEAQTLYTNLTRGQGNWKAHE